MGFRICLLSNSSYKRVSAYAEKLGVLAAPIGGKPLQRAFKSALAVLDAKSGNTAIIGDQIFTDIWGGNRMGLYTILVDPISKREFFGTKLARLMEKLIAKRR